MARLNASGQIGEVGLLTEPDPSQAWANWSAPSTSQGSLSQLVCEDREGSLFFKLGGEDLGTPSIGALRNLSTRCSFPVDFLDKLPPPLRAEVINARIQDTDDLRFTFTHRPARVNDDGHIVDDPTGRRQISNISPGWRGILAEADVCQTIWQLVSTVYGGSGDCVVEHAVRSDTDMRMRVMVPYDQPVRPGGRKVGDVLQLGFQTLYEPGVGLSVGLAVKRLVCTNGMTACEQVFDWKAKSIGRPEDQLNWLTIAVAECVSKFDDLVERARLMASTPVDGDPEQALIERARAMRIPTRFDDRLMDAFRQEPGAFEWDMLNAITRMTTHGGLPMDVADRLSKAAGDWTSGFDMVTARLPRPIAMNVGARIMED